MKITEFKGSEVLPEKKCNTPDMSDEASVFWYGHNKCIDAYNSVEIDGLVEELAEVICDEKYGEGSYERWIQITSSHAKRLVLESRDLAKSIISQMPKWVVLRKGK